MKYNAKEIKIALVAIVGIVVLYFGMNFLKGLTMFSNDETYYISFRDITGLSGSNPIYANGFKIGVVKDFAYDYSGKEGIKARIGIDKRMVIPQGSTAEIVSDVLGNVQVNLKLNRNTTQMLRPGDVIPGDVSAGMVSKVAQMVPAIEAMLPKLDSILVNLNVLLTNPDIPQSLHNVKNITGNLTTTTQQLNTLMSGLNRQVPKLLYKANGVLDNTHALTANLAAVDVNATMNQVNQTLANVQALTERLNSNEGSLGLLMTDPSLYNNLNSVMRNADSLVINLRQHPKRYVHFSLFGRKDK